MGPLLTKQVSASLSDEGTALQIAADAARDAAQDGAAPGTLTSFAYPGQTFLLGFISLCS